MASFSADLASLFTSEIGVGPAGDTAELQAQISGRAPELSLEQREKRKLAKRIIKSIQPQLEDAIRKESELNRKPYEKELKELDAILDHSVMSRRGESFEPEGDHDVEMDQDDTKPEAMEGVEESAPTASAEGPAADEAMSTKELEPEDPAAEPTAADEVKSNINIAYHRHPTPILSDEDQQLPLAQGGIQWYMQPFDPIGTTVHEERWTGRDVMRGMSEELSELDEDELKDLVDDELDPATKAPDTVDNPQNVRRTRRLRG